MASNKEKYLKEINKDILSFKGYNVGDIVSICISGYFKIVGFTSKEKFVLKMVMTKSFRIPEKETYDSFYIWSVNNKVEKEDIVKEINKSLEIVESVYG